MSLDYRGNHDVLSHPASNAEFNAFWQSGQHGVQSRGCVEFDWMGRLQMLRQRFSRMRDIFLVYPFFG